MSVLPSPRPAHAGGAAPPDHTDVLSPQVVHAERWGLEPCALPVIVNISSAPCDTLDFSPLDESSSLIFYNVSKHPRGGRQSKARVLQAGTPLGLMAYLYSRCSPVPRRGERRAWFPRHLSGLGEKGSKKKEQAPRRGRRWGKSCLPSSETGLHDFHLEWISPGLADVWSRPRAPLLGSGLEWPQSHRPARQQVWVWVSVLGAPTGALG